MSPLGWCYYKFCQARAGHAVARGGLSLARRAGLASKFLLPVDALQLPHPSVAGLMKLWERVHWNPGDGMMPADQLLAIYDVACRWPAEGDVVELGSWVGVTTSYLATACRVRGEGHVYAVDTFAGTKEDGETYHSVDRFGGSTLQAFQNRIERARVMDLVTPLVGLTTRRAVDYPGRPIRVLLIDADHSYEGVSGDFRRWAPLVRPGGLIIFHDYAAPQWGVQRFVDETVATDDSFAMSPGLLTPNVMAVTRTSSAVRSMPIRQLGGAVRRSRTREASTFGE